ncbi:hypothetical protein AVEN_263554-1 [Araneus ventricosus]|uniref:Uncharacterized protein n=1 Tax=Araneus ventricosus TaxID=182803 RepID=A0A4Y2JZC3_ARAVE|nr:hypothetical protein AVEN_263554-1 [Araneus ventricosus]
MKSPFLFLRCISMNHRIVYKEILLGVAEGGRPRAPSKLLPVDDESVAKAEQLHQNTHPLNELPCKRAEATIRVTKRCSLFLSVINLRHECLAISPPRVS